MKDVKLKLISELMKNSRRSDRDLAKIIGVSQPTITRTRTKLEKEGYIKDYTMIPDLVKLGYDILAFSFIKLSRLLTREELTKVRKIGMENLKENPHDIIFIAMGSGLGYSGVVVSIHKSYASYVKHKERLANYKQFGLAEIESFMVSLTEEDVFLPLTLSILAQHLSTTKKD